MNDMESMVHHFNLVMDGLKAPPGKSYFEVEGSKVELGMNVVSEGGSKPDDGESDLLRSSTLSVIPKLVEADCSAT